MNVDEVLKVRAELYERSMALVAAKGHDYGSAQQAAGDTLFNLRASALLGVVDLPERGVLVRLLDKFARRNSLLTTEPMVTGETFEDTVVDIHNYVDFIVCLRRERTGHV